MRLTIATMLLPIAAVTPAQTTTAQTAPRPPVIVVTGTGSVETPPDRATLSFYVTGEGTTADDATRALAAKLRAVGDGLRSLDRAAEVRTGGVAIAEVRRGRCDDGIGGPLDDGSMMGTMGTEGSAADNGPCRVVGRRASAQSEVRMRAIRDAGTAVGLAGRLGASSARIDGFALADARPATARAVAAAVADARAKAQAIATGAGVRLGDVQSINDGNAGELQTYALAAVAEAPPAIVVPPPVAVAITPKPVQTEARLTVTFALLP